MQKGEAPASSADNALRLVLLLAERHKLRVTESAQALEVAPSTAHRLLATLCRRGFASKSDDHSYVPGPAFRDLDLEPSPSQRLRRSALLHMAELTRSVGETTHLVVLEGVGARFVECVESPAGLRVSSRVGYVFPAHSTSGGKALLAELEPSQLRALYADGLPESPAAHAKDVDELLAMLGEIRHKAYALNQEESEPGIVAVGAAVHDHGGTPVGALSISIPSVRYQRRSEPSLVAGLRRAVQRIEQSL